MSSNTKIACGLVIVYLTIAMIVSSCSFMEHSHCEDIVISQGKSPDGKYLATVSHRTCSSGSKFTYVEVEETPPYFWSPRGDHEYILDMRGYHTVSTFWTSTTELDINCPFTELGKTTTERKDKWRDITFTYKMLVDEYR